MSFVSPYRITPEELEGLDKKTLEGLAPLLDALNTTIQQLVSAAQGGNGTAWADVNVLTGADVADSFPLTFRTTLEGKPRGVFLANITPRDADHVLTTPFVMQGWGLTDNGMVSIPAITGLLASNSYALTFLLLS